MRGRCARRDSFHALADETDGRTAAADLASRPEARRGRRQRLLPAHVSVTRSPTTGSFAAWSCGSRGQASTLRAEKATLDASPDEALRAALLAKAERAEGARARRTGAARQHADPSVVRHVARGRRQDARDVRLGAGGARARRACASQRHDGSSSRRWPPTARSSSRAPVAPTGPAAIDEPGTTPARAVFDMRRAVCVCG